MYRGIDISHEERNRTSKLTAEQSEVRKTETKQLLRRHKEGRAPSFFLRLLIKLFLSFISVSFVCLFSPGSALLQGLDVLPGGELNLSCRYSPPIGWWNPRITLTVSIRI